MADELFTYVRKNEHDVQEKRRSKDADDAALRAQGFMRLDEVTGNAEDASVSVRGRARTAGPTSAPTTEETKQPHERYTE